MSSREKKITIAVEGGKTEHAEVSHEQWITARKKRFSAECKHESTC